MLAQTDKANLPAPRCTLCGKAAMDKAFKPFCSKRCADIELGRWLNGSYSIPSQERPSLSSPNYNFDDD